jgi:Ca2+-binding EF-hand superfamily protein
MNQSWIPIVALFCLALAVSVLAAEPTPAPTPRRIDHAFEKADADKDGQLSKQEAAAGGLFTAEAFYETDDDGDGYVSLFELGEAVAAHTRGWLDEHDKHDTNDDGHIDRNEATFGTRIYTVFDRADKNKDDQIDSQEMKDWAASSYYSESASYPIVPNIINKKF